MTVPIDERQMTPELRVAPELESPAESCSLASPVPGSAGILPASKPTHVLPQFSPELETVEIIREDNLGTLYRVHNLRQNRDFAVRYLGKEQLPTPEVRKNFLRFCRRYTSVTHSTLAAFYSFTETPDGIWFLTDLYSGLTLEDLIDSGDFKSSVRVLELFDQLMDTIETLHQVGIRCGAMQPSSIFVEDTSHGYKIRFRDWFAQSLYQAQQGALGSEDVMHYASPEFLQGDGNVDVRSDVYSFGVLLYEALAGRRPHVSTDPLKLAIKIMNSEALPIEGPFASSGLSKIALRCLSKDPAKRHQTLEELRADMKAAAMGGRLPSDKSGFERALLPKYQLLAIWVIIIAVFGAMNTRYSDVQDMDYQTAASEAEDRGDLVAAEASWQAAVDADPENSYNWYNLGRVQAQSNEYEYAMKSEAKAIELDNNFADAYDQLAHVKYELGQPTEAIAAYRKAIQNDPTNGSFFSGLSLAYWQAGRMDEAIEAAKSALRLDPDDVESHYSLGFAYDEAGKFALAAKEYEAAIALNPDYSDILTNLSLVYSKLSLHDKATAMAMRAAAVDPGASGYWANLAHAYMRAGKLQQAESEYRHALSIDKFDWKAWAGLSETLDKLGRTAEAADARKALMD